MNLRNPYDLLIVAVIILLLAMLGLVGFQIADMHGADAQPPVNGEVIDKDHIPMMFIGGAVIPESWRVQVDIPACQCWTDTSKAQYDSLSTGDPVRVHYGHGWLSNDPIVSHVEEL